MSKVARAISQVAGIVATVAMFIPGGQPVAAVAAAVSTVSGAVAQVTAKKPGTRGTVSQVMIGSNMPIPYAIGRTFSGGHLIYDDSAGGTDNTDRTQIFVYSCAGPIEGFEAILADYTAIAFASQSGGLISGKAQGFYGSGSGFLWANTRLGHRPDTALTPPPGRAAFRGWGANHKVSGFAAASVTMKFDKDGKRWASGIPAWGAVGSWVKVYDPRLDSTWPGGSGPQRWDDEASWAWSDNPALHALAYARGRFVGPNDRRVVGVGIGRDSIRIARFVELANIAEANGWKAGGIVYEGPGFSKWDNLKRILQAAAAEPLWAGGELELAFSAPKVALDTVTADDLAGPVRVRAAKAWRERINRAVPRYRSEAHKWEYVQAEAVVNPTYLAEDGEEKTLEVQFDLVQDKDQAARLAAYDIVNAREFEVGVTVKPRLIRYRPGEALELDLPEAGMEGQLAVIRSRVVDPATGTVQLTLVSETDAKHAWALGRTGVAPPTPTIYPPDEVDEAVAEHQLSDARIGQLIATSWPRDLALTIDSAGVMTISAHERVYSDQVVAVDGASVTPSPALAAGDKLGVYYDDPAREGGAVDYQHVVFPGGIGETAGLFSTPEHLFRHFVALMTVPSSGSSGGGSGTGSGGGTGGPPGGGGGDGPHEP